MGYLIWCLDIGRYPNLTQLICTFKGNLIVIMRLQPAETFTVQFWSVLRRKKKKMAQLQHVMYMPHTLLRLRFWKAQQWLINTKSILSINWKMVKHDNLIPLSWKVRLLHYKVTARKETHNCTMRVYLMEGSNRVWVWEFLSRLSGGRLKHAASFLLLSSLPGLAAKLSVGINTSQWCNQSTA